MPAVEGELVRTITSENLSKIFKPRSVISDFEDRVDTQTGFADHSNQSLAKYKIDFIVGVQLNYEESPKAKMLGNLRCYFYSKATKLPRIVIGPQWMHALTGFLIVNISISVFLFFIDRSSHPWIIFIGIGTLLAHDFTFLVSTLSNPGLPPRDISPHSESYINRVKI